MKPFKGEIELRWKWSRLWFALGAWCFHYDWSEYPEQPKGESQWRWVWKSDFKRYGL